MDSPSSCLFEVEIEDGTLILTPFTNLGEFDCVGFEQEVDRVLHLLETTGSRAVVIDFHRTDYCGSTALGFLIELRKRVRSQRGEMVLCCLSDHEREILAATKLDKMWSICPSRKDALQLVGG